MSSKIHEFQGDNRWLSNFWKSPFTINKIRFETNEHWYQWNKFTMHPEIQQKILNCKTAGNTKKIARQYKHLVDKDFHSRKLKVMFEGLYAKFTQNNQLELKLVNTGTKILEEGNNWGDEYWGINLKTGKGYNHLGQLLMILRDILEWGI